MKINFKISPQSKEKEIITKPIVSPQMPHSFPVEIPNTPAKKPVSRRFYYLIFFALVVIATVITGLSWLRQLKYGYEIAKIDREYKAPVCEQYALKAKISGWFPCLNCGSRTKIYLKRDEVWRYGMTGEEGKDGRYPNGLFFNEQGIRLDEEALYYQPEFIGTRVECIKEEKRKIYSYPLLPECQLRDFKLDRPPGNKRDY